MVAVVDLFAGAGGFGIGAQQAGCDLRLSVEVDRVACDTLQVNASRSHRILQADLTELDADDLLRSARLTRKDKFIVVGGAPCQPFSKASNWIDQGADHEWRKQRSAGRKVLKPPPPPVRTDPRRDLLEVFAQLVVASHADGFVFENVSALLSKRNRPVLDNMVQLLTAAGYSTRVVKFFASQFGVAQHRERVFVLGSRGVEPQTPSPSHYAKTVAPELNAPLSVREVCAPFAGVAFKEPEEQIKPTETYFEHLNEIDPGRNYKQLTDWDGYPERTGKKSPFVAERRYWNFLLVLDPDKPSPTIPARYGSWNGPFHWQQSPKNPRRRLRTVELAAIQDFPPDYEFVGTWGQKVRQIGNAVPPSMAASMITEVAVCVDS